MPSLNYITRITNTQRIRVNVCEGQVNVTHEETAGRGRWQGINGGHIGPLTRQQAEELAQSILTGLRVGF